MSLLDLMLKRDSADLDMQQTIVLFATLTATLPVRVFSVLPPDWKRDAERLARAGHIALPKGFDAVVPWGGGR
jgi:hypothetical protein